MKIVKVTLLALLACLLVACTSKDNYDWLEGRWWSSDWHVTYEITEKDQKWTLMESDVVLLANATLSTDKEGYITLQGEDGTQYIIKQKSDSAMDLQMVAADELLGVTNVTSFQKVKMKK